MTFSVDGGYSYNHKNLENLRIFHDNLSNAMIDKAFKNTVLWSTKLWLITSWKTEAVMRSGRWVCSGSLPIFFFFFQLMVQNFGSNIPYVLKIPKILITSTTTWSYNKYLNIISYDLLIIFLNVEDFHQAVSVEQVCSSARAVCMAAPLHHHKQSNASCSHALICIPVTTQSICLYMKAVIVLSSVSL